VLLEQLIARLQAAMVAPAKRHPQDRRRRSRQFSRHRALLSRGGYPARAAPGSARAEGRQARGEFRPMDVESTAYCVVAPMMLGMLWRHSFARHEHRPLDADACAAPMCRSCCAASCRTAHAAPLQAQVAAKLPAPAPAQTPAQRSGPVSPDQSAPPGQRRNR